MSQVRKNKVIKINRDINPNNVMISEVDNLKVTLIDFNVSRRFRDSEDLSKKLLMMTNTGAAAFCSPEIYSNNSYE